ncbi:MAG: hypothetical protein ACFCVF_00450 [Kineosporiaceae bacterium]
MTPVAHLLVPYRQRTAHSDTYGTPGAGMGWRFRDAPPDVVAEALSLSDPDLIQQPPNDRPPPAWLVRTAHQLDGRLMGVAPEQDGGRLRVDGITVRRPRRHDLVRAVSADWPDQDDGSSGALESAVGEVYPSWGSLSLTWKGPGHALAGRISRGEVVGLWWP